MTSRWSACGWGKTEEDGRGGHRGPGNGKEEDVEDTSVAE